MRVCVCVCMCVCEEILQCRSSFGDQGLKKYCRQAERRPSLLVVAERPFHSVSAKLDLLLNLGLKASVQLPLLIVHLTQDHIVLQEKLVPHAKSKTQ